MEIYETDYRKLLTAIKSALPNVQFVICQPFILTGKTAVDQSWFEPFSEYQVSAESIIEKFGAIWVSFQKVFDEALGYAPAT